MLPGVGLRGGSHPDFPDGFLPSPGPRGSGDPEPVDGPRPLGTASRQTHAGSRPWAGLQRTTTLQGRCPSSPSPPSFLPARAENPRSTPRPMRHSLRVDPRLHSHRPGSHGGSRARAHAGFAPFGLMALLVSFALTMNASRRRTSDRPQLPAGLRANPPAADARNRPEVSLVAPCTLVPSLPQVPESRAISATRWPWRWRTPQPLRALRSARSAARFAPAKCR